nr:hypothetical protein [Bacilli bacterium]
MDCLPLLSFLRKKLDHQVRNAFTLRVSLHCSPENEGAIRAFLSQEEDLLDTLIVKEGEEYDIALFDDPSTFVESEEKWHLLLTSEDIPSLAKQIKKRYGVSGKRHYEEEEALLIALERHLGALMDKDEVLAQNMLSRVDKESLERFAYRRKAHFTGEGLPGSLNKSAYYAELLLAHACLREQGEEKIFDEALELLGIYEESHRNEDVETLLSLLLGDVSIGNDSRLKTLSLYARYVCATHQYDLLPSLWEKGNDVLEDYFGIPNPIMGKYFALATYVGLGALDAKNLSLAEEIHDETQPIFLPHGEIAYEARDSFFANADYPVVVEMLWFFYRYAIEKGDQGEIDAVWPELYGLSFYFFSPNSDDKATHYRLSYRNLALALERHQPNTADVDFVKYEPKFDEFANLNTGRHHLSRHYFYKAYGLFERGKGRSFLRQLFEAKSALTQGQKLYPNAFEEELTAYETWLRQTIEERCAHVRSLSAALEADPEQEPAFDLYEAARELWEYGFLSGKEAVTLILPYLRGKNLSRCWGIRLRGFIKMLYLALDEEPSFFLP